MRIAELSRDSGVPVPTIKYYMRERLLPPGELTSPNQAQYDDAHLRRLKLIRALIEVGGLSIAATRDVLASIDAPGKSLHETLGKAQYATTPRRDYHADEQARGAALQEVDELIARRAWQINPASPARQLLAEALAAFHGLGQDDLLASLDEYADAAEQIAAADVNGVLRRGDLDSTLEGVVVGTVLGDTLLAALRRLAQENVSAQATPAMSTNRARR
jgi:DNA-binding transcriptional MerR regulator